MLSRLAKNTLIAALMGSTFLAVAGFENLLAEPEPLAQIQAEHIMLATSDYHGTISWYRENLGFRIKHEWTVPEFPNLQLAYLEKNGFIIEVVASPDTPQVNAPKNFAERLQQPGIGHFAFLVSDVDAVTASLAVKGIEIIVPPTSFPDSGRRLSFVEDNNGYMIEFLQELPLGERVPYTGEGE
ncbi:MAG: VOC family protein [Cyanobacteria bacterium P01_D01_bin.156]